MAGGHQRNKWEIRLNQIKVKANGVASSLAVRGVLRANRVPYMRLTP